MKFCSKCGNQVRENQAFCEKCGNPIMNNQNINTVSKIEEKKTPVWLIVLLSFLGIFILFAIIGSIFFVNIIKKTMRDAEENTEISDFDFDFYDKENYSVNETFDFDNLEITISDDVKFKTYDNKFDDDSGKNIVKVPITVKNTDDESHSLNMYFYKIFGPKGLQLNSKAIFFDDSIDFAEELRPEASYTKYLYFLYDGDGKYTIEFDNFDEDIEVNLDIKK